NLRRPRQPEGELRATAGPVAAHADLPTVQLDESLDQCQPQSETAAAAVDPRLALRKSIEDARHEFGFHANAGVADADDCAVVAGVDADGDRDTAAASRELGGIAHQVAHDLGQPRGVARYP